MANLKYDETFPLKVAEYAAKGDTDARIAARLGIALSTFYTYKEQFPEFAKGLLAGRRICYSRVRAMLLKVARGQFRLTTRVYKNGDLYKTTDRNLPPNLKAIIYFQKHMRTGKITINENTPPQDDSKMSNVEKSQTEQTEQTERTERTERTSQTRPASPTTPAALPAPAGAGSLESE